MKIAGNLEVSIPPDQLWDLLNDPEFLKEVMPGCKEMKQISESEFEGSIGAKVGAIASQYSTRFSILEKVQPKSYTLKIDGNGKGGFVRGKTFVELVPNEIGTLLKYDGEIAIGGTIARIGQRLVEAAAKMLLNQGIKALKNKIEERV